MHNLWKDQLKKKKPQTDNATVSEAVSTVLSPEKAASAAGTVDDCRRWQILNSDQHNFVIAKKSPGCH